MKSILVLVSLVLLISFSSCSGGGSIPPEVCTYGEVACQLGDIVCDQVPGIPPEVCTYLNVACVSLNALCSTDPGSPEYEKALSDLRSVNDSTLQWIGERVESKK